MNKTLFILDLDGTIADATRRLAIAGLEPSRTNAKVYQAWVDAVQDYDSLSKDPLVKGMHSLCWALASAANHPVLYLTAREEKWREVTASWLTKNSLPGFELIMRPDGNLSNTGELKEKFIKIAMFQHGAREVVVIDDDPRGELADVCKQNGWTFLKALSGS